MYKIRKKICEHCNEEFTTRNPKVRFCSHKCANTASSKYRKPASQETREKLRKNAKKMWQDPEFRANHIRNKKEYYKNNPDKILRGEQLSLLVAKGTRGKYRRKPPESILELSKRTVSKILKRLEIGCCICGWNKCVCDIHHINGKQVEECDKHSNLTCVCPNCHREIHGGLVDKKKIISLDAYIGDTWKKYYYG